VNECVYSILLMRMTMANSLSTNRAMTYKECVYVNTVYPFLSSFPSIDEDVGASR
jgi:hypothetical protein